MLNHDAPRARSEGLGSIAEPFRYERTLTTPTAFRQAAEAYPQNVAVVCRDVAYTYAELDAMTERLARRLASAGVRPGAVVATLTERSVETVIAWLAINKCGGVYLPYDPAYPMDTLRFMIEDARPVLAFADRAFDRAAAGALGAPVRSLEEEIAAASIDEDDAPLTAAIGADAPAYIMYTSGSTGRPKGVIVPHRAIARLVRAQNYMPFGPDVRFLLASALAFDATTLEVWGPLLNGGTVVVLPGARASIDALVSTVADHRVNALWLTAGLFHAIVDENPSALAGLDTLLTGGDVVSPEHANKLIEAAPHVQLVNGYGPTEATTFSCCWRAPKGRPIDGALPIGVEIAHSSAMILDDALEPAPDGETGTLWVGGDGVALGYLNRPELTEERFRPDPFSPHGGMMYCTGDVTRRRPDGSIEFLGRRDRQVKIDGKRIELDEIEHNLRADPRIDDVVVALRQEGARKTIVAFVKLSGAAAGEAALKAALDAYRSRMPAHMTPHRTQLVAQMPLTPNGKVDRKKLIATIEAGGAADAAAPQSFESGAEEAIAEIWAENLGHRRFGREDNFFDVGGTSMLMMRVHVALQKKLERRVAIPELFAHPRIAELAKALEGDQAHAAARKAARDRGARQKDLLRRMRR